MQFDELLRWIKAPQTDTLTTLFAISRLSEVLGRLRLWPQIENILLTQVFCWPLIVLSGVAEQDLAVSLPVAVDIDFEGQNPKGRTIVKSKRPGEHTRGGVNTSQWHSHLELAVEAAKELWRGKHGNHGIYGNWRLNPDDFRWKVEHAHVIFEFHWANCILGDIPLALSEGSADAYFAMAVLGRLLGRRGYLSSAITGVISDRCREEEDTTWEELGPVDELRDFMFK